MEDLIASQTAPLDWRSVLLTWSDLGTGGTEKPLRQPCKNLAATPEVDVRLVRNRECGSKHSGSICDRCSETCVTLRMNRSLGLTLVEEP